jgi:predicted esterase
VARRVPVVLVVLAALLCGAGTHPVLAGDDVRYVLPGRGEVLRPFEPARSLFGPGHRGVDLDHPVGGEVVAAAAGVVRYAGAVAGVVWVSVEHADGVTTSYGPLRDLTVATGDPVGSGQPLGRLAPGGHGHAATDRGLHWGARRDGVYIDPLSLLAVRLRPTLVGPGGWWGTELAVTPYDPWAGGRHGGLQVTSSPIATRPGFAVPPNGNHLILVRGLGSASDGLPFDPADLGYAPASVTAHSYAGPVPGDQRVVGPADDPWRHQRPYGPEDTWQGVEAASAHLRDQLRARWAAEPGRAVDLVGYSMGGVVILHYLTHHHDAYDPTLPPVGHVVALASPLQGSDVAAVGSGIRDHHLLGPVVGRLQAGGALAGAPPLDARALEDLRPDAEVIRSVADGWRRALELDAAGPLAMGTRVLTVAGHRDRVVAVPRTTVPSPMGSTDRGDDAPGHVHRVLPGDHGSVLATEALREVTWRFLAGEEVVPSPGYLPGSVSLAQSSALRVAEGVVRFHDATSGAGARR